MTREQIKELAAMMIAGPALQMSRMANLDLCACFLELAEAALTEAQKLGLKPLEAKKEPSGGSERTYGVRSWHED